MISKLTLGDVPKITQLHLDTWDKSSLSMKLGPLFLNHFYQQIVTSPLAEGYVYRYQGNIIGYATGFFNFPQFNRRLLFKPQLWLGVFVRLLTFRLSPNDLTDLYHDPHKYSSLSDERFHLGALALQHQFQGTKVGRKAIYGLTKTVMKACMVRGAKSIWGSTAEQNIPMRRLFEKLKFKPVAKVKYITQNILVYENCQPDAPKNNR